MKQVFKDNMDSVGGYSGLVLCTGNPTNHHGRAEIFGKLWDLSKDVGVRRIPISRKHKTKASFLLPGEIHELIAVSDPKQPISYNTVCDKGSIVQQNGNTHHA